MNKTLKACLENKSYNGIPVIQNKKILVESGSSLAILGRSGIGKTTLLRILAGIGGAYRGNVNFTPNTRAKGPSSVQYLDQQPTLLPWLTVESNIELLAGKKSDWRSRPALSDLGVLPLLDRYPGNLSGGEKQAVALFRALASAAEVFLLDEPFHSTDAHIRAEMRKVLRDEVANGKAIVLVTHDPVEAVMLCNDIQILKYGVISDENTKTLSVDSDLPRDRACDDFQKVVSRCRRLLDSKGY